MGYDLKIKTKRGDNFAENYIDLVFDGQKLLLCSDTEMLSNAIAKSLISPEYPNQYGVNLNQYIGNKMLPDYLNYIKYKIVNDILVIEKLYDKNFKDIIVNISSDINKMKIKIIVDSELEVEL